MRTELNVPCSLFSTITSSVREPDFGSGETFFMFKLVSSTNRDDNLRI